MEMLVEYSEHVENKRSAVVHGERLIIVKFFDRPLAEREAREFGQLYIEEHLERAAHNFLAVSPLRFPFRGFGEKGERRDNVAYANVLEYLIYAFMQFGGIAFGQSVDYVEYIGDFGVEKFREEFFEVGVVARDLIRGHEFVERFAFHRLVNFVVREYVSENARHAVSGVYYNLFPGNGIVVIFIEVKPRYHIVHSVEADVDGVIYDNAYRTDGIFNEIVYGKFA